MTGFAAIFLSAVLLAAFVARRNLRMGRGDRGAARTLSLIVFTSLFLAGLLSADHAPDPAGEWGLLIGVAGNALYHAAAMWLFYIAAEPYVRRRQPELLISWNRVLRGYFRDPVGGAQHILPASRANAERLIALFETEKTFYELQYELDHRPDWAWIPLSGIAKLTA